MRLIRCALGLLTLALILCACGGSWDGSQWKQVEIVNDTTSTAHLVGGCLVACAAPDGRDLGSLNPGDTTSLTVDTNNDPQGVRVVSTGGSVGGCLVVSQSGISGRAARPISEVQPCTSDLNELAGQ